MKLSALFSKFLYQNKELRLPGIGVFSIDPSIPFPDAADKNFNEYLQHIRFEQKPVIRPDESFISFIRTETGKIKPLAESDLDSFLSDGKILLNIGKPFHIEGIGYLQKNREGLYEFTPGDIAVHRPENTTHDQGTETTRSKSFYTGDVQEQNSVRKILIGAGVIAGIVLIVWGGYYLYNRNASPAAAADTAVSTGPDMDSAGSTNILLDSVKNIINSTAESVNTPATGTYKFVIERTANKARALRRYNQIRENLTDVKMETKDSVVYSLYFLLPAQPSDTTRIKDSLRIWYGRKQVFIEP